MKTLTIIIQDHGRDVTLSVDEHILARVKGVTPEMIEEVTAMVAKRAGVELASLLADELGAG